MSNLPLKKINDSGIASKLFFDRYGSTGYEFKPDDVSAAIGFFQGMGFEDDAAIPTAMIILQKAKNEARPVFEILDTLKNLDGVQLSAVVSRVLNQNRASSSRVGFKTDISIPKFIERNIIP